MFTEAPRELEAIDASDSVAFGFAFALLAGVQE